MSAPPSYCTAVLAIIRSESKIDLWTAIIRHSNRESSMLE